jgi:hypothetical protein
MSTTDQTRRRWAARVCQLNAWSRELRDWERQLAVAPARPAVLTRPCARLRRCLCAARFPELWRGGRVRWDPGHPELCRRPGRSEPRTRSRSSSSSWTQRAPAVAIRRHVRLLGEGEQGAWLRGAHRRCADRAITASPKSVGRPGGASSGLDVSVRRQRVARDVGGGQRVGGDGEGGGGVSGVDGLAFEQVLGDQRGPGEPARVALAIVAVDRAGDAGERVASVGAHLADEQGLGIARRTVEQLVGEAEPGSVATATEAAAIRDRLEVHVALEPGADRNHPLPLAVDRSGVRPSGSNGTGTYLRPSTTSVRPPGYDARRHDAGPALGELRVSCDRPRETSRGVEALPLVALSASGCACPRQKLGETFGLAMTTAVGRRR